MKEIIISLIFIYLSAFVHLHWTFTVYKRKIKKYNSFDNSYYSLDNSFIESRLENAEKFNKKQFKCTVREIEYYSYKLSQKSIPFELSQIDKENCTIETY